MWMHCPSPYLVPPEPFKSIRRKLGIPDGVLNIPVPKVGLQGPSIHAVVRQLETTGMSEHVGMDLDLKAACSTLDHSPEAGNRER